MNTFKGLIESYENSFTTRVILLSRYAKECGEENLPAMVLMQKLDKYSSKQEPRGIAKYISLWINEELGKLPVRAKALAKEHNLKMGKLNDVKVVGYPHSDGTYHWL